MGKVVELDTPSTESRAGRAKRRRKRSKTALVLGGGGFTGGVYEIGALRALDLLAVNRTVNEFDVYVGTSAGVLRRRARRQRGHPRGDDAGPEPRPASPLRDIDLGDAAAAQLPRLIAARRSASRSGWPALARELVGHLGEISAVDVADRARRAACRTASTAGDGIAELRRGGARRPRPHQRLPPARARALPDRHRPRHDRAHRPRRGRVGRRADLARRSPPRARCRWSTSRSRSRAASSSTAASARRRTSTSRSSTAPSSSSSINPIVPYVNDFSKRIPTISRHPRAPRLRHGVRRRSRNQSFRVLSHDRLHRAVAGLAGGATRASTSS